MKVLITGGTGFIGYELVRQLYPHAERIVVYSRSESKQAEMRQEWPEMPDNKMRYFIGDIRDRRRLITALSGCTHCIHAAALKRVEVCAYDPGECLATNVLGTQNVADACHEQGVDAAVFISTDKAVEPITTYGKAKAFAEDLWIRSNIYGDTRLSVVRYANVHGSTGSLWRIWLDQLRRGEQVTVTHPEMTRMWISAERAAEVVIDALRVCEGGEIVVPYCEGTLVQAMAESIVGAGGIRYIGLRPHEKIHETLISESDARNCYYDTERCVYVVYPVDNSWGTFTHTGHKVPDTFRMTSKNDHLSHGGNEDARTTKTQ